MLLMETTSNMVEENTTPMTTSPFIITETEILTNLYIGILSSLGLISNFAVLIVLIRRYKTKTSATFQLIALAIADLCFLFMQFVDWVSKECNWQGRSQALYIVIYMIILNVTYTMTSWMVVLVGFDR